MNKPKIRCCNNCEYHEQIGSKYSGGGCLVYYKLIHGSPRLKAIFCRHYKQKEELEPKFIKVGIITRKEEMRRGEILCGPHPYVEVRGSQYEKYNNRNSR